MRLDHLPRVALGLLLALGCTGTPQAPQTVDEVRASRLAIENLLNSFEMGMFNRDLDILEGLLSEEYLDPDGLNKEQRLRGWAGPRQPDPTRNIRGFLYEACKFFRLEDRRITISRGAARITCKETSQWVNKFLVMRETRKRQLQMDVRWEDDHAWRIVAIRQVGPSAGVWSNEYWFPPAGQQVSDDAVLTVTANVYEEGGFPETTGSRMRVPGGGWMPIERCRRCGGGEEEGSCCTDYCGMHAFHCMERFGDPFDVIRCRLRECFGRRLRVPGEIGLGEVDVELQGESGVAVSVSHRFELRATRFEEWEHFLVRPFARTIENSFVSAFRGRDGVLWFGTHRKGRIFRCEGAWVPRPFKDLDGGIYEEGNNYYTITAIAEDAHGRLWFGVTGYEVDEQNLVTGRRGKVVRYDGARWMEFEENLFGEGRSSEITAALGDRTGGVWFAGEGVRYWDGREERFTEYYSEMDGIGASTVSSLVLDRDGNLWCGTRIGGVSRFDAKTRTWSTYTYNPLTPSRVSLLEEYIEEIMRRVFQGEPLKIRVDPLGLTVGVAKEDMIWSAVADGRGHLWFGTYGGGLLVFRGGDPADNTNWDRFTVANTSEDGREGLVSNIIPSLAVDARNRIWIGTMDGINCLDDRGTRHKDDDVWETYTVELFNVLGDLNSHSFSNTAWGIAVDQEDTPWFATLGGGVLHLRQ